MSKSDKIKILSVNISEKKGTVKIPQKSIELNEHGVKGDAHSGKWHRQVSLLAKESIDKFSRESGRQIKYGEFAENITTEGILLHKLNPMDLLMNEEIELMVTQIGKKCHGDNCNIFKEVGNCVMPKEGIFAKVIKGGKVKKGDTFKLVQKVIKCAIIVLSDRASIGEYKDKSGTLLKIELEKFFQSIKYPVNTIINVIPDEEQILRETVYDLLNNGIDIIFTSGGTGIGPRDITPEVIDPILEKEIPGIMDAVRLKFGTNYPNSLISRSKAGIVKQTLVFTLPGSPKAVIEYFNELKKLIYHLLLMVRGLNH